MRRAYLGLLAGVVAAALVAGALARAPRPAPVAPRVAPALPAVTLALVVDGGRVAPDPVAVPKGRAVALAVENRGARAVDFRLAGYEDGVHARSIAPGATWRARFDADLPGEDFAWLVDDQPAGRLAVTGSHLVEGHR